MKSDTNEEIARRKTLQIANEALMSYVLTSGRRNWGVYEERFLLKLVEIAQIDIQGLDFKDQSDLRPVQPQIEKYGDCRYGGVVVRIPINSIMAENDRTNYTYIMEKIGKLTECPVRWEDVKRDRNNNPVLDKEGNMVPVVKKTSLITKLVSNKEYSVERGYIYAQVDIEVWNAILNFTKGFKTVDLNIAMKLKNKYAVRFYEFVNRQSVPITYSLEKLREIFGLENKYKQTSHMLRMVIDVAKKELDEKSPYTFDYKVNRIYNGKGKGRNSIASITFIPRRQPENFTIRSVNGSVQNMFFIDEKTVQFLKKDMLFNQIDLMGMSSLLFVAHSKMTGEDEMHPTLFQFLVRINGQIQRLISSGREKYKEAYVVSALKNHLFERYDYIYSKDNEE